MKKYVNTTSVLGTLFGVGLLLFVGLEIYLAAISDYDSYDGFLFIVQSRRLFDLQFIGSPLVIIRPRGLVILLVAFDALVHTISGKFPTLVQYHTVTIAVALGFIAVWFRIVDRLFGTAVAFLSGLLLLIYEVFIVMPLYTISDALAGLSLGVAILFVFSIFDKTVRGEKKQWAGLTARSAIGLGVLGAFCVVSKYQQLPLYPLLIVFIFAAHLYLGRKCDLARLRQFFKWTVDCVLSFLVTLELIQRIFSGPEQGVGPFFRNLFEFTRWPHVATKPFFYYPAHFLHAYGPLWILFLIALPLVWFARRKHVVDRIQSFSPNRQVGIALIAVVLLFTLASLQWFPYAEARYLISVLPALLGFFAWAILRTAQALSPRGKMVWNLLLVTSLFHPILRCLEEVRGQTNFIRSANHQDQREFFHFLNAPLASGKKCSRIEVCGDYFQYEDLGSPGYQYFTGILPDVKGCASDTENPVKLRGRLSSEVRADTCYVVRQVTHEADRFDSLVVQKPFKVDISPAEANEILQSRDVADSHEKTDCERTGSRTFACYHSRRFFGHTRIFSPVDRWVLHPKEFRGRSASAD